MYDKGQVVTHVFGTQCTLQVFVVRKTPGGWNVAYIGAIGNDNDT
ncbi:MAG: hypothetical protein PW786_00940 [Arachidicoccus sp.]|nr:hypothetical protein [Arachidicoccus sp.]